MWTSPFAALPSSSPTSHPLTSWSSGCVGQTALFALTVATPAVPTTSRLADRVAFKALASAEEDAICRTGVDQVLDDAADL